MIIVICNTYYVSYPVILQLPLYPSLPALQIETKIEPWLLTKYAILVYICVRVCVGECVYGS